MILCVVDDIMFASKIKTAARAVGREVAFERAADNVVTRVREAQPSLVILDLNATKLRPMETIAALKAAPDLASTRTLGYVSHVQTDVINAARAAGIDEVVARSAFSERLGEILEQA
jgi:DNA-binding NarL/FixJ family response regulator